MHLAPFLVLIIASRCCSGLECYPEHAIVMQNPFDYLYRDHDVEGMSDG